MWHYCISLTEWFYPMWLSTWPSQSIKEVIWEDVLPLKKCYLDRVPITPDWPCQDWNETLFGVNPVVSSPFCSSLVDKAPWVRGSLLTYSQMGVECCRWRSPLSKRQQRILLKRAQAVHKVRKVTHPWTQWSFSELGYSYTGRLNKCLLTRGWLIWEGPALCHHLTTVHHLNMCLCKVILKGIRDETSTTCVQIESLLTFLFSLTSLITIHPLLAHHETSLF